MNLPPARKCRLCGKTPGYPLYNEKCIPCWPKDLKPALKAKRSTKATKESSK